jgi:HAD superfamily hydrolase (TIGR01457 family)
MPEPAPADLLDRYDCFLFDLDGVLYRGDEPVPEAREAVGAIRAAGRPIVFITNNSSRTPEEVAAVLVEMGIDARAEEIMTSALATAEHLRDRSGERAFVVGERGVRKALTEAGLIVLDGEPDAAELVVVGLDRSADYDRLKRACLLVERGAALVATNPDRTFPAPDGLWPGAGALLAVIVSATGSDPVVVGKPNAPLFEAARKLAGGDNPLVVGDRLDTDIAGAAALGWASLLVLTGVSREEDLATSEVQPTFVAPDLGLLSRPQPFATRD